MRGNEEIYTRLRNLYSGKDIAYDSFRKGRAIEELVNSLIKDIVNPCSQELHMRYGKHEFDGEVVLGKGNTILYEIYGGSLSMFRFNNLLDIARSTYFPKTRTYLVNIARRFSKLDRERIYELTERIATSKVKLCFMDYEVLISLHRFSADIQADNAERGLKTMKRLFLSKLFDSDSIINKKLFQSALSFAKNRYRFEIPARARPAYLPARIPIDLKLLERRMTDMEKLLLEALSEIRQMRKELDRSRQD